MKKFLTAHFNLMRNSKFFLVFLSSIFYILYSAPVALAATLYFYPQNLDVFQGENVVLEVRLNTDGETINALEVEGGLAGENMTIDSADTSNSLVRIFIEPARTDGKKFRFIGGAPGGFNGVGIIGRLNLTALATGNNAISFNEPVKIFTNSEKATQSAVKFLGATFNVIDKPEGYIELSSRTHAKQNAWHNAKEVNIHWDLAPGAEYSYLVSLDQTAVPDEIADKPAGDKLWLGDIALNDLTDGIYYFTVKEIGSHIVSRYSIFQDVTPPEWVSITLNKGTPETENKSYVSFLAKDSTSGIDYYEIKIDDGIFEQVPPPNYIVNKTDFRRIVIKAYDRAGNTVEQSIETKGGNYSVWIGSAFVILIIFSIFIIRFRKI
ncbi:MAG: hypothetical protein HYR95_02180 [Candidatus Colwellbacteria bacterium]|nr:hypothetical protein [Candidatus Colwellbacteria bacterium]